MRLRSIPTALTVAVMTGCSSTPADNCDASVSGRSCFDTCVFEGTSAPQACVAFCDPIPPDGGTAACSTDAPGYVCRLTRGDAGVYVDCVGMAA